VGRRVGFESWVERDHLVALDFDPSVTGIVSQPFCLLWPGESKTRRHAPDFLVRLDDDAVLVLVKLRTEFWQQHFASHATSTPFPEIRHFK
jgi:hypothetical protein